MKVLFLNILYPNRSPSARYRYEQFIPFLEENGINCTLGWIINKEDEDSFYYGGLLSKVKTFVKATYQMIRNYRTCQLYDAVFVQREAYFLGTSIFERMISRKTKLIFDFDDSIWLSNVSKANRFYSFLKNPNKTKDILKISDVVIAGNKYLAKYAMQYNKNVEIVPTSVDTDKYIHFDQPQNKKLVIGWTGSHTTISHFELLVDVLLSIKSKYDIDIRVIGDDKYSNKELGIKGIKWSSDTEVSSIQEFDIGIMPLPVDKWSMGKCGFKAIQCMAVGLPVVATNIGVNSQIIQDDVNGYLASNNTEWIKKLSILIENTHKRREMGEKARNTIINHYSTIANKEKYLNIIKSVKVAK